MAAKRKIIIAKNKLAIKTIPELIFLLYLNILPLFCIKRILKDALRGRPSFSAVRLLFYRFIYAEYLYFELL